MVRRLKVPALPLSKAAWNPGHMSGEPGTLFAAQGPCCPDHCECVVNYTCACVHDCTCPDKALAGGESLELLLTLGDVIRLCGEPGLEDVFPLEKQGGSEWARERGLVPLTGDWKRPGHWVRPTLPGQREEEMEEHTGVGGRGEACGQSSLYAIGICAPRGGMAVSEVLTRVEDAGKQWDLVSRPEDEFPYEELSHRYPEGDYLAVTEGHIVAVVDGQVVDTQETADSEEVKAVFRITSSEKIDKLHGAATDWPGHPSDVPPGAPLHDEPEGAGSLVEQDPPEETQLGPGKPPQGLFGSTVIKQGPPRPGLVPQTGDWNHPGRWIRPEMEYDDPEFDPEVAQLRDAVIKQLVRKVGRAKAKEIRTVVEEYVVGTTETTQELEQLWSSDPEAREALHLSVQAVFSGPVTLYRGGPIAVKGRQLDSWTTDPQIARDYSPNVWVATFSPEELVVIPALVGGSGARDFADLKEVVAIRPPRERMTRVTITPRPLRKLRGAVTNGASLAPLEKDGPPAVPSRPNLGWTTETLKQIQRRAVPAEGTTGDVMVFPDEATGEESALRGVLPPQEVEKAGEGLVPKKVRIRLPSGRTTQGIRWVKPGDPDPAREFHEASGLLNFEGLEQPDEIEQVGNWLLGALEMKDEAAFDDWQADAQQREDSKGLDPTRSGADFIAREWVAMATSLEALLEAEDYSLLAETLKEYRFLVEDGKVQAFAYVRYRRYDAEGNWDLHISSVVVHPDNYLATGARHGSRLMMALLHEVSTAPERVAYCTTVPLNDHVARYYRKVGFEPSGQRTELIITRDKAAEAYNRLARFFGMGRVEKARDRWAEELLALEAEVGVLAGEAEVPVEKAINDAPPAWLAPLLKTLMPAPTTPEPVVIKMSDERPTWLDEVTQAIREAALAQPPATFSPAPTIAPPQIVRTDREVTKRDGEGRLLEVLETHHLSDCKTRVLRKAVHRDEEGRITRVEEDEFTPPGE